MSAIHGHIHTSLRRSVASAQTMLIESMYQQVRREHPNWHSRQVWDEVNHRMAKR